MNITRIRALRGPNLWSRHTAIEAVVECSAPEQDIGSLPGFEAALRERFAEIGPLRAGSEGKVSMANGSHPIFVMKTSLEKSYCPPCAGYQGRQARRMARPSWQTLVTSPGLATRGH